MANLQPSSVAELLRGLSIHEVAIEERRYHIRQLWADSEHRRVLEPLTMELRQHGLL